MTSPLHFIPGWCLGRGPLNDLVKAINGQFIDLPGYHGTPLIEDFAAAVRDVAAALPENATLGGWSLGAMLALAVAAEAPTKVGRLVLIAGTPSFVQREGWPWAMPEAALSEFTRAIAADPEAMLPRFVGGFNRGDGEAKQVTRQLLETADARPATHTLLSGLQWLLETDLRSAVDRIRAPSLIIQGANDPLMPAGAGQWLGEHLAGGHLVCIPETAHAPFVSAGPAVIAAIRDFLRDT